jgi:hypothetical protein
MTSSARRVKLHSSNASSFRINLSRVMAWSRWPTTLVPQLTFSEWNLTLRAGREVLVGYTLSYLGVWHVFGDDKWVWFNGVIRGSSGGLEIVRQWAEAEN